MFSWAQYEIIIVIYLEVSHNVETSLCISFFVSQLFVLFLNSYQYK